MTNVHGPAAQQSEWVQPFKVAADITPIEPCKPMRFANATLRRSHVVDHPIESRDERWHQLVSGTLLSQARDEWSGQASFGPACEALTSEYEALLAECLQRAAEDGTEHAHLLSFTFDLEDHLAVKPTQQTVRAWISTKRLVIIAGLHVRNQADGPYVIKSGYRASPEQSARRFAKDQRSRVADLTGMDKRHQALIALHDGVSEP
jgi:hypothetical protein